MNNKIMGGDAYRGDCPTCGKGLFGSMIHHCPKSARAVELAKKRKEKLTKQILETTKDFGIEKSLEGWDAIYERWVKVNDRDNEIEAFVKFLKGEYFPPKLKEK